MKFIGDCTNCTEREEGDADDIANSYLPKEQKDKILTLDKGESITITSEDKTCKECGNNELKITRIE
ncbi:MAG: hypothetical protein ACOCP8_03410 [archaeon]